ncbi:hypothetical protein ACFE04_028084 [Oxalis oulophora]
MEVSAASFRKDEVNDDECVTWAAIEKLPTMDRVRKGLFKPAISPTDQLSEIDVIELSVQDKKILIRRLVKDTHFDNERFLSSLRRRLDSYKSTYAFFFSLQINQATNQTLGVAVLKSRSFFPYAYWYWIRIGALVGFIVILNVLYTLFLTVLSAYDKKQGVIMESENEEGGAVELNSRDYKAGFRSRTK